MTLDGSLQRWSVTCRYHSMPSPTPGPYIQCMCVCVCVDLDTMRGERTTQSVLVLLPPRIAARFRMRTCSFLSVFFPALFPSFLYSLLLVLLSSFANGAEWFQSDGFRGRRVAATKLEGGWWRFCPSATRCIVPLLYSSLILRSTCVANLRKPWPPPSIRIARFPPFSSCRSCFKFLRAAHPFAQVLSSYRENMRSFVRNWRDDYARSRHAKSSFTVLWWHVY